MKLATFQTDNRHSYGAVTTSGVIDIGQLPETPSTLHAALIDLNTEQLAALVESRSPDYALDDITYAPPVTDPEKIICIGVNYVNRNEEYDDLSLIHI